MITTVNVQHLESVNDLVETITGVRQQETVPDVVVREAQQVELVDMTPEALRRRMAHGNIYPAEKIDAALSNYFRPGNLAALRELALLWVADRVDESLQAYLEAHGIADTWETRERIVVAVTGAPGGGELIRRAARIANRTRGDLVGVHVSSASGLRGDNGELERHRTLVRDLGGIYHEIVSDDPGRALVQFAHERARHAARDGCEPAHPVAAARARQRDRHRAAPRGRSRRARDRHRCARRCVRARRTPAAVPGWRLVDARSVGSSRRSCCRCSRWRSCRSAATSSCRPCSSRTSPSWSRSRRSAAPARASSPPSRRFLLENFFFVPPLHTFSVHGEQNIVALFAFLAFAVDRERARQPPRPSQPRGRPSARRGRGVGANRGHDRGRRRDAAGPGRQHPDDLRARRGVAARAGWRRLGAHRGVGSEAARRSRRGARSTASTTTRRSWCGVRRSTWRTERCSARSRRRRRRRSRPSACGETPPRR